MKVSKKNESGSGRLKFLLVLAFFAAVGYVLYLYVPVEYQAFLLKDTMQHDVDVAATQGYPLTWVQDQLTQSAAQYEIPGDVLIEPGQRDNRVEVRVRFTRPIEFPGYTYEYKFDYTARSTTFLTFK